MASDPSPSPDTIPRCEECYAKFLAQIIHKFEMRIDHNEASVTCTGCGARWYYRPFKLQASPFIRANQVSAQEARKEPMPAQPDMKITMMEWTKPVWERIDATTDRLAVPGGWILRTISSESFVHQIFIPNQPHSWFWK